MKEFHKEHSFYGRLVMIGFGCIGQGALPLLLRHIDIDPQKILILNPDQKNIAIARGYQIPFLLESLTPDNFSAVLSRHLKDGDFLLNLSVNVSSVSLIQWCQTRGVLYLDTCIEPWQGGYTDPALTPAKRTNYALRESVLALRQLGKDGPTAVITHGANPGLVSHFVKQALLNMAHHNEVPIKVPDSRKKWAALASLLNIHTVHIAERDTQVSSTRKQPGEFVNTWSVEAFIDEACQPAELGWGSHERHFPPDAERHSSGSGAAIFLNRPGAATRVRTWTPLAGPIHGFLITHAESISIADYFTLDAAGTDVYRPTVHYAYHPCDDAVLSLHELAGRNWKMQGRERVLKESISSGIDELGVLMMGNKRGAYWYGSQLSIEQARELCPNNSATSLQVTVTVMAGVLWAMKNPNRGILEPDDLPYDDILHLCRPYLGNMAGAYTDWTPLLHRNSLFNEDLDQADPWQFKNFRVM